MKYVCLKTAQMLENAGFKRPNEAVIGDVWYLKRADLPNGAVNDKTAYIICAVKETTLGKRVYMYPLHDDDLQGDLVFVMVSYGNPLEDWTFAPGLDDLYKEMEGYVVSYYAPFWMCSKIVDKGGGVTFLPVTGMDKESSVEALAAGYLAKKLDSK